MNISNVFKGTPKGAPGGPPRQALSISAVSLTKQRVDEREAAAMGRGEGALVAGRRQPGPLPLARQRIGAGRCRHAVSPAPDHRRSRHHALR